jgi:hypothetical protein
MNNSTLNPTAADRLAKLCGMFGSAYDGERATAAAMADRELRAAGLTWEQLVEAAQRGLAAPSATRTPGATAANGGRTAPVVEWLCQHQHLLSSWERGFVEDLRERWRGPLTAKQSEKLRDIERRLRAGRRAACAA